MLSCAGRPHTCVLAGLAALVNLSLLFTFYVALENGEGVKSIVKDIGFIAGNNDEASGGKSRRTSCHCVLCGDDGDGEHAAKSANTTHENVQRHRQQQQYEHTFSVKIRGDGHGAAALHLVS